MSDITKNHVINSAKNAQSANPNARIVANLVLTKRIFYDSIEQFEKEIFSLRGDKIKDCQIEVRNDTES